MTDSPNHNISKQNDVEPAEAYSTKRRHERDWALRAPREHLVHRGGCHFYFLRWCQTRATWRRVHRDI